MGENPGSRTKQHPFSSYQKKICFYFPLQISTANLSTERRTKEISLVALYQTLLATHFDLGGTLFINQKPEIWNCVTFEDINGGGTTKSKTNNKKHKQTPLTGCSYSAFTVEELCLTIVAYNLQPSRKERHLTCTFFQCCLPRYLSEL